MAGPAPHGTNVTATTLLGATEVLMPARGRVDGRGGVIRAEDRQLHGVGAAQRHRRRAASLSRTELPWDSRSRRGALDVHGAQRGADRKPLVSRHRAPSGRSMTRLPRTTNGSWVPEVEADLGNPPRAASTKRIAHTARPGCSRHPGARRRRSSWLRDDHKGSPSSRVRGDPPVARVRFPPGS